MCNTTGAKSFKFVGLVKQGTRESKVEKNMST